MPRWHVGVGVLRGRHRAPQAVQEALFEIELRPERRYYRQILQALTGALIGGDQLHAEIAVSRVLGIIWSSDPLRDGGAEEVFGRGLVDFARQTTGPVAANLLRALAATATVREVRDAAAEALAGRLLPPSGWEPDVGSVVIGRCWVGEDAFGDHATVLCEFGYGATLKRGPRHGVAVQIDRLAQGAAVDVTLVEDVDVAELDLRLGAEHASDEFRRVEPGWAGAVLEQAVARTDLIPSTPVAPGFAALRALALSRVRALPSTPLVLSIGPEATPGQREAVVAEFCAGQEASSLGVPALAVEQVARLLVDFASQIEPSDLLRVSPGRIEAFLFDWLPAAVRGSANPAAPDQVVAVVSAWSAWAARQGGTPLLTRDALARAVDEILDAYLTSR
jgi:hypothetical protein